MGVIKIEVHKRIMKLIVRFFVTSYVIRKRGSYVAHFLRHFVPTGWESSRLMRKPFMDENEHGLEVQTRRLSELQLSRRPVANQESYFGYSMDEIKASEGLIYSEGLMYSLSS